MFTGTRLQPTFIEILIACFASKSREAFAFVGADAFPMLAAMFAESFTVAFAVLLPAIAALPPDSIATHARLVT